MRTKLSITCDHIIEAGWLLAVVLVPLFFNVYSSRVFEPDKLGMLRSVATLMAIAWLVRTAEGWWSGRKREPVTVDSVRTAVRRPLMGVTLLLVAVYLLATVFSVVPRVSFWGSYQRLQGTYSTLSYLVIFALLLQNLRRQAQLERLITLIIITSIPASLYGLLQHYALDPLPWGGETQERVASHMGNAIFIGAYLIMVIPLTLVRILALQSTALEGLSTRRQALLVAGFWLAFVVQAFAWASLGFARGLAVGLVLIAGLALLAGYLRRPMARFVLLGAYSTALAVQLVCLFFSQSRGPILGLFAGLFFFGLLYLFVRRWRAASLGLVGLALGALVFLGVFNLPRSPLAALRDVPYVGRLGQVFETEGGTGKVRVLIWQGALELLQANPLRTLVGYGPESMYVAYNPYYPPDLAHYESRNASPDRSHNETFDALITTGVLGLIAYLVLFGSLVYHILHWLGLVGSEAQARALVACGVCGSLLGILVPWALEGSLVFAGVGLPLGFLAGLGLYVTVLALRGVWARSAAPADGAGLDLQSKLLLLGLLAAVVGHLVEINFGIAVAVSRTYFWIYAALALVVGQGLLGASETAVTAPARTVRAGGRKSRRREMAVPAGASAASAEPPESTPVRLTTMAVLTGFVLITLLWDYATNPGGGANPFRILYSGLATMAAKGQPEEITLGVPWLLLATGVLAMLICVAELVQHEPAERSASWWMASLGRFAAIAWGMGALYALVHAARLAPGMDPTLTIYEFAVAAIAVWGVLTVLLLRARKQPESREQGAWWPKLGYVALLVVSLFVVEGANLRIVRADILYKQGLRYDQRASWDDALHFYKRAMALTPQEDYYYLFGGRALIELGKIEADATARDTYFEQALAVLRQAQYLSPLNTDHTANLARLYRTWADYATEESRQFEYLQRADRYYAEALQLSRNSALLHNEHGLTLYSMGDLERAEAVYRRSLELDARYAQTYLLLGDVYLTGENWEQGIALMEQAVALDPNAPMAWNALGEAHAQTEAWEQALEAYQHVVALQPSYSRGWSSIGYCASKLGRDQEAISANLKALTLVPNDYATLKNLALLYQKTEQPDQALAYAQQALAASPDGERDSVAAFVAQLQAAVEGVQ
ncbi:MAG: O-antigen ligase family protein [Anaerolineae bacterium]